MVVGGLTLLLLLSLPLALAECYVSEVLNPLQNAQMSPFGLDPSAILILFRALLVFSVVCLVGAFSGRILPTMLIGMVTAFVMLAVLETAFIAWRGNQVSVIDPTTAGALPLGSQVATLDGHLVGTSEAQSAMSLGPEFSQRYQLLPVGLSPSKREEIIAEECAAAAFVSIGLLTLMVVVIETRRTS